MGLRDKLRGGRTHGRVQGQATILSMELTRMGSRQTQKRNQQHSIRLSVAISGAEPYEVTITCDVPWNRRPLIGHEVPALVSVQDPQNVRIGWDQMPTLVDQARAAADAANRGDAAGVAEALDFHLRTPAPPALASRAAHGLDHPTHSAGSNN
jgi:hypothetical protein